MSRLDKDTQPHKRTFSRKSDDLFNLAIEIVTDNPKDSLSRLARFMVTQIEKDKDLRELALYQVSEHKLVIARNYLEKATGKKRKLKLKRKQQEWEQDQVSIKAFLKVRDTILNLKTEIGKKFGDLTGNDLLKLKSKNGSRFTVFSEFSKSVKGKRTIKSLDDRTLQRILKRTGDASGEWLIKLLK
jgi:hypothetical protein